MVKAFRIDSSGFLIISDTNTLIQATVDGMGIAMMPAPFVNTHIINGDLIKIENVAEFPIVNIYGMYPTRKHVPYRLSLFLEYPKSEPYSYCYSIGKFRPLLP